MENAKEEITVIGAGKMGLAISQLFAQHGCRVILIDSNKTVLQQAKSKIEKQLSFLKDFEYITSSEIKTTLSNITFSTDLNDAKHSWLIVEAIPEVLQLKQELFKKLELICDASVILATNTSGLPIDSIGTELKYPERFIGAHFFMPADIIPLVEVIKGKKTNESVLNKVLQFLQEIDKHPVLIKKDIPGFIGNRIQHAMAREAISLLEEGIATAEDIDTVVRWGLGIRLLFTGPLEQRDLNGLDLHHQIATYLYKDLYNSTEPAKLLTEKVERGDLGIKTGKGFYEWDEQEQQTVNQKKNIELLQLMKAFKK